MSILVDVSKEALSQSIGDNFAEALKFMHACQPTSTWYSEALVERAESDVNLGWYNPVIIQPASGHAVSSEEFKSIRDLYRRRNKRAYWFACSADDLTDLHKTLETCGLRHREQIPGMAIDLETIPENWTLPQGVTVKEASTESEIRVWNDVLCRAYPMPPVMAELFSAAANLASGPTTPQMVCYTFFYEGEPAGTVAAYYGREHVGLYTIGTLEEARGRGIGTAATIMPLLEARRRGYHAGVLHATRKGYGVYERVGFKPLASLTMWMDEAMIPSK